VEAWLARWLDNREAVSEPQARSGPMAHQLANLNAHQPAVRVRILLVVAQVCDRIVEKRRAHIEDIDSVQFDTRIFEEIRAEGASS